MRQVYVSWECDVIVASISLTTFGAFPILVPNIMAQRHVPVDLSEAFLLCSTSFGNIILLFSPLTPIRLGTPSDCAHAMILFIFTSFNGFKAFGRISILIMANIALQTAHILNNDWQSESQAQPTLQVPCPYHSVRPSFDSVGFLFQVVVVDQGGVGSGFELVSSGGFTNIRWLYADR